MGYKIPFLVGIGITCRTCVTKWNCTPSSHFEHCGKAFIFNEVSERGTCFSAERRTCNPYSMTAISAPSPCNNSRKGFDRATVPQNSGVSSWLDVLVDFRFVQPKAKISGARHVGTSHDFRAS